MLFVLLPPAQINLAPLANQRQSGASDAGSCLVQRLCALPHAAIAQWAFDPRPSGSSCLAQRAPMKIDPDDSHVLRRHGNSAQLPPLAYRSAPVDHPGALIFPVYSMGILLLHFAHVNIHLIHCELVCEFLRRALRTHRTRSAGRSVCKLQATANLFNLLLPLLHRKWPEYLRCLSLCLFNILRQLRAKLGHLHAV